MARCGAVRRERVNYISTRGPKLEKRDIGVSISRLRVLRAPSVSARLSHRRSCAPLALVKRKGSIPRAGNSWRIMSTVAWTTVYYGDARVIKNVFCIMQDNQARRVWDRCGAGAWSPTSFGVQRWHFSLFLSFSFSLSSSFHARTDV